MVNKRRVLTPRLKPQTEINTAAIFRNQSFAMQLIFLQFLHRIYFKRKIVKRICFNVIEFYEILKDY